MRYFPLVFAALAAPTLGAPAKHRPSTPPPKHEATSAIKAEVAPSLPSFTFMGHNPDVVETPTKADGSSCSPDSKRPGVLECTDFLVEIAGLRLGFLMRSYYQGKLYTLFGTGSEYAFPTLLQAFTTKYGPPIMGSKTWQNKAGATFDNTIATWKFRNGTLELDSMGLRRDQISFEFNDHANDPPLPPAKVDF